MKVSRRKSPLVVQAETRFQLSLASLADSDKRMIFNDHKSLAPYLEPPGGAAFLRIKYRDTSCALDRNKRERQRDKHYGHRSHGNPASAVGDSNDRHGDG